MKLNKVLQFDFEIVLLEGTSIRSGGGSLEIGGIVDSNLTVIRDTQTEEPYIPGSSLKGKIRSTVEALAGRGGDKGKPCGCGDLGCPVCPLFGAHMKPDAQSAPTRIVVRDSHFTPTYREHYNGLLSEAKPFIEYKSEVTIDRDKGTGKNPRTMERVPPGAAFTGQILIHVYDADVAANRAAKFQQQLEQALGFIMGADSIGSGGSRGSGRVEFRNTKLTERMPNDYRLPFETKPRI